MCRAGELEKREKENGSHCLLIQFKDSNVYTLDVCTGRLLDVEQPRNVNDAPMTYKIVSLAVSKQSTFK